MKNMEWVSSNWMKNELRSNWEEYNYGGETNCTRLAENCAQALDLYEPDGYTIPEYIFDIAVDIAEQRAV